MRITFVYPDLATDNPNYTGYFHHGIAALSAILKKPVIKPILFNLPKKFPRKNFKRK